jgi:hypothetical protein
VVVDAGHDLELGAVLEVEAPHYVHLPQLHGAVPLEPAELLSALPSAAELDQAVAAETAVDAGA